MTSNDAITNVVLRDIYVHFQGHEISGNNIQNLENGDSQRKMLKNDFYRGSYYPSNGAIANALHRDLDLYFQGPTVSENM